MLHKAIVFAFDKHHLTVRKGSLIPYVTHPLEVMTILLSNRYSETLQIAGLLHDTLEDTDTTYNEILVNFGYEVASLVLRSSEDKSQSWAQRKQHTLDWLEKDANEDDKILVMADKLSNLRSIYRDSLEIGDAVWERFNQGMIPSIHYYEGILQRCGSLVQSPMYFEYKALLEMLKNNHGSK